MAEAEANIEVTSDEGVSNVTITPTECLYLIIASCFGVRTANIEELWFGNNLIEPDDTCEDLGIEDGARLSLRIRLATFQEVVYDIIELNPDIQYDDLMNVTVDPNNPSNVIGDIRWTRLGIYLLPESIGDLTVGGNLDLAFNKLTTLPESFGKLTVDGDMNLSRNKLTTLPKSFGELTVGGDV